MRVTVLENARRPGVGRAPVAENRRAWLPQQARFCPVLEDGSRTGLLVFPPLDARESLQIRYLEQHVYRATLFVRDRVGTPHRAFVVDVRPSGGTGGVDAYDVRFLDPAAQLDDDAALALVDALTTNVNTPQGGIGLRGAHDFVTPNGWDTIYTGVLNEQQRPHLPTLTVRVETDWYAQSTEFRYVLEPGEILSASGSAPIGQVFFVPREQVTIAPGSAADAEQFRERQRAYWEARAAKTRVTNFGTEYTYHYREIQKQRRVEPTDPAAPRAPSG